MCDTPTILGLFGAGPSPCRGGPVWPPQAGSVANMITSRRFLMPLHRLFLTFKTPRGRDAERFHLSIEVAPLHAEDLGGPRHVALLLGERPEDQVALEPVARFVQRQPFGRRGAGFGVRRGVGVEEAEVGRQDRVAGP